MNLYMPRYQKIDVLAGLISCLVVNVTVPCLQRYHIVNGINAVDVENEAVADRDTKLGTSRGVPGFWLTAMKTNKILVQEVRDFISYYLC